MMPDNDPLQLLIERLTVVRKRFDAKADDWQLHLLKAFLELADSVGIEEQNRNLILRMIFEVAGKIDRTRRKQSNKRGRAPDNHSLVMAMAAAAVSALHRRDGYETIEAASREVSAKSGLSWKKIEVFRNNINRGKVGKDVPKLHDQWAATFKNWPTAEILKGISVVRDL